jgi:hypothetical protein
VFIDNYAAIPPESIRRLLALHLVQAENGIAPGHRVALALIALHLLQIVLRPLEGVIP